MTAMPDLVVCEFCDHGAMFHTGSGCEVPSCRCIMTRQRLVEEVVEKTRVEIALERLRAL